MSQFITKEGDGSIALAVTMSDEAGAVDLTGYTTTFEMKPPEDGAVKKIAAGVCVNDPDQVTNKGKTSYAWQAGDLDTIGEFECEFIATNGPLVTRFPRVGYLKLVVTASTDTDFGTIADYYCSEQDMNDRMSTDGIINFTDHTEAGAPSPRTVSKCRERAKSQIDFALHQVYDADQLETSDLINDWATVLACYYACILRGNQPPESLALDYDDIMKRPDGELALIEAGKRTLPGLIGKSTNAPVYSNLTVERFYPTEKIRVTTRNSSPIPTLLEKDASYYYEWRVSAIE